MKKMKKKRTKYNRAALNGKPTKFTLMIERSLKLRLKKVARERRMSMSDVARQALEASNF